MSMESTRTYTWCHTEIKCQNVFQVGGEQKVDCLATILGYDLAENFLRFNIGRRQAPSQGRGLTSIDMDKYSDDHPRHV